MSEAQLPLPKSMMVSSKGSSPKTILQRYRKGGGCLHGRLARRRARILRRAARFGFWAQKSPQSYNCPVLREDPGSCAYFLRGGNELWFVSSSYYGLWSIKYVVRCAAEKHLNVQRVVYVRRKIGYSYATLTLTCPGPKIIVGEHEDYSTFANGFPAEARRFWRSVNLFFI